MKKIVVMLLALVMVFGLAAPAMALELKELDDVQIGGSIEVPSIPDETDDDDDASTHAIVTPGSTTITKKPSKLTSTYVGRMKIDAYYYYSGTEKQSTITPTKGGKLFTSGTGYTINDVVAVEESDPYYGTYEWKTSVTFHFAAGDSFIQSVNTTLNEDKMVTYIGASGNWVYQFSEAYPADQTVTFYRVGNNWAYLNSAGAITKISGSSNINIGHIVRAQVRLENDDVETYTVTYIDGMGGAIFRNQSKVVKSGNATPAFTGNTNASDSYLFLGWNPEIAETVTADALYTAQWKKVKKATITFNANGGKTNGVTGLVNVTTAPIEVGSEVNLATAYRGCSTYKSDYIKSLSSDYSTNYRLAGWNTQKDGKGTHYDMDATITMFDTATTLYAEWESYEWIHWNVTLGQGGASITHKSGSTTLFGEFKMYCNNVGTSYGKVPSSYYTPVEVTASEDWEFAGWYDGETLVSDNAKLTSTAVSGLRKLTLAESGAVLEARFDHTACKEHLEFVKTIDEPTCTEVGHDLYKCTVCRDEYTIEVPALGHTLLPGWIHNREEHWHKCTRCGELLDVAEHSFTEWTSVYGEKNKEERHCTVCSYSEVAETVKINANGNSSKPASSEENPNTGAEVPSVLPAIAVLAVAAVVLGKKR